MKLLSSRTLIGLLLALFAVRLISLGLYPLGDTSEARYGEVARQMLSGGNWITPFNDPGIPFWAKPPLSFWAQAASMAVFGVNEFGARISSLLFSLGIAGLIYRMAQRGDGVRPAIEKWLALLLLSITPIFFVMAGAVMTDVALAFATTLSMAAFWLAWTDGSRRWGYAFFIGLGLSMLAKGPVGVALTLGSIGLFWLITPDRSANLRLLWQRLPWLGGIIVTVLIAAPWYIAAEERTPGFLQYFLVGEHILRFIQPGWKGDMYGNAHLEVRGMVWIYLLMGASTLLPFIFWAVWNGFRQRAARALQVQPFDRYLLAWILATPIFFTAAGNTLWTYVLPCMPALSLWLARRFRYESAIIHTVLPVSAAALTVIYAIGFLAIAPSEQISRQRSTKALMQIERAAAAEPAAPLLVLGNVRHSMKFYSRATAQRASYEQILAALDRPGELFVVVPENALPALPDLKARTSVVTTYDQLVLLHRP